MRCVLGVDGGSSKTHALVLDSQGSVLGFGQAGGGNHQVGGLEAAVIEISAAIRQATEQAKLTGEKIEMGCYCLAGADLPEDFAMLRAAVEDLGFGKKVIVKNDSMAALRAGLSRSWGVVVVCGSGFNAAGRSPTGEEIVLPALGSISGDWGGGADLAQEMIRLVARAWDGRGKPTQLTEGVLDILQAPSVDVLISRLYRDQIEAERLLGLVPFLFRAASAGDEVARDLVVRMGTEVGITALALVRRLDLLERDVEIVLAGSVYKGQGPLLLDTIRSVVHAEAPRARIFRPRYASVVGAALLALDALDVTLSEESRARLESALPDGLIDPTGGSRHT